MDSADCQEILFFYDFNSFNLSEEEKIKSWLLSVFAHESQTLDSLNIVFCSDSGLLKINREYLNHDYYTDIISFQYEQNPIEAELFISIERVQDNAKTLHVPFGFELLRVMVHGVLHCLGYRDKEELDILEMRSKEDFYLHSDFIKEINLSLLTMK